MFAPINLTLPTAEGAGLADSTASLDRIEMIRRVRRAVCRIVGNETTMSGFFVTQDGVVATTAHQLLTTQRWSYQDNNNQDRRCSVLFPKSSLFRVIALPKQRNIEPADVNETIPCTALFDLVIPLTEDGLFLPWEPATVEMVNREGEIFTSTAILHECLINERYLSAFMEERTDLCLLQLRDSEQFTALQPLYFNQLDIPEDEGEDIVLGGFPFGSSSPSFHAGMVSSIQRKSGKVTRFQIGAPVVPGNSGSPVVVQRDGALTVIGVIRARMADISPEFLELSAEFQAAKAVHKVFSVGKFNILECLAKTLGVVERNLVSGIGRAIPANRLMSLYNGDVIDDVEETEGDLPVGKRQTQKQHLPSTFTVGDKKYYLARNKNQHAVKHQFPRGSHVKIPRGGYQKMTENNAPALFASDRTMQDNDIDRIVLLVLMALLEDRYGGTKTFDCLFEFPTSVGASDGEKTPYVILEYSGTSDGSHIRPVSSEQIKNKTPIVLDEELFNHIRSEIETSYSSSRCQELSNVIAVLRTKKQTKQFIQNQAPLFEN